MIKGIYFSTSVQISFFEYKILFGLSTERGYEFQGINSEKNRRRDFLFFSTLYLFFKIFYTS
jgi:hypothetical protein